jgi:hypothetical protein
MTPRSSRVAYHLRAFSVERGGLGVLAVPSPGFGILPEETPAEPAKSAINATFPTLACGKLFSRRNRNSPPLGKKLPSACADASLQLPDRQWLVESPAASPTRIAYPYKPSEGFLATDERRTARGQTCPRAPQCIQTPSHDNSTKTPVLFNACPL